MVNTNQKPISEFLEKYFLHFNAASLLDAAKGYEDQLNKGAKMLVSMAGAMSTAEIGKIFAEVIRKDMVHIISCTGANLEEDIMNLVAHSHCLIWAETQSSCSHSPAPPGHPHHGVTWTHSIQAPRPDGRPSLMQPLNSDPQAKLRIY